ncbi:MAG: PDZ domain-containing protein [Cytophagales bacterium]|nr:PDZ domain-containing protein [Cytophagales bacterium]
MKHRIIVFFCAFLLADLYAFGQSAKEQLSIANSAKLVSENFYDEVNFNDKLGYFTIQVKIDTNTYEYIFDTGGYNTVTTKIMETAKLPSLMEVEVGSSNKIRSKINLSKVPLLRIGKATFADVGVFNFDFSSSPVINCYTNGGLIGKSVIREAVWQVDYRKSVIRVSDNLARMPNLGKGEKIKIEFDKTLNPFLKLSINGRQERFMLDFGYGGLISLTEKTAFSMQLKNILKIEGEGNISANGVVKETTYIASLEKLVIGKNDLKNKVAYYSKSNNYNLLGSELTKYFIVTLNFKDKELILTPYSENESSFETFGFSINLDSNKIYVSKIFDGLSAQKVGLLLNDEIIGINGKQLSGFSNCDRYFNVNNFLKTEKEILLQVKRGEKQMDFRIVKQKPF